jgi:hypothetical protein
MKIVLSFTLFFVLAFSTAYAQPKTEPRYTESFDRENCHFTSAGYNPYFFLRPGYQLTLRGVEDKDTTELVITVLNETKKIGDVDTRIMEEYESVNGKKVEVSKNYVAICRANGSIFYFGEDVDIYKNDSIVSHEGAWMTGENNKPGILLPGMPMLGARYYQEMAPGIAMDRAEIVSMTDSMQTPAGTFYNVLKVLETTPLDPKDKSYKYYAPQIGLIKDGNLVLVNYKMVR